jgi:hypothetical protein
MKIIETKNTKQRTRGVFVCEGGRLITEDLCDRKCTLPSNVIERIEPELRRKRS